MTWFKVDDSFHGHPKVAELEAGRHFAEAIALWTLAGSWSAHHLMDGFVPMTVLRRVVPFAPVKAASELVRVGLWEAADGGYQFRDWIHYQPTKQEVESSREGSAKRSRRYREKVKERDSITRDATRDDDVASRPCHAAPSRPDPIPPPTSSVPQPEVVVDDGPPERLDVLPGTPRWDGLTVGYVVDRFGRYMAQETGSIPLSLAGNTDRTKRLARGVLEWAKQHDPEDPRGIVRASAFAFAKRYAAGKGEINGTRVRDPLALWASNPGVWMEEAS